MSSKEFEAQLTLKDRLNFPYLLANQILTFQKAILNQQYSKKEIQETIEGFVHLIPKSWRDNEFLEDLYYSEVKEKIDVRPLVTGRIRVSEETCHCLGIPAFREEPVIDYYQMFQACVNLLDRRGLTSRRTFTEKMTGRPFTGKGSDIANTEIEEL